ncbi:hypothetical protein SODALDRAFT_357011 [Sodiomyces alkalinus F11]|uniref:Uncharacterized protein n=1 Tax=Sodiomyces alkalinus (strain CBS 110278 / VKM F-3762 / F11) TaxID=1314773 RepID=A0A3N2Q2J2_SODAK|nr:hypothetical protein SODALDRAFT_357011 [Sodiomyces alkalinus F11]ROT40989.1 hypothetical protein SODALDRAFT_357011 [Sodiomyces alkalinus F11]
MARRTGPTLRNGADDLSPSLLVEHSNEIASQRKSKIRWFRRPNLVMCVVEEFHRSQYQAEVRGGIPSVKLRLERETGAAEGREGLVDPIPAPRIRFLYATPPIYPASEVGLADLPADAEAAPLHLSIPFAVGRPFACVLTSDDKLGHQWSSMCSELIPEKREAREAYMRVESRSKHHGRTMREMAGEIPGLLGESTLDDLEFKLPRPLALGSRLREAKNPGAGKPVSGWTCLINGDGKLKEEWWCWGEANHVGTSESVLVSTTVAGVVDWRTPTLVSFASSGVRSHVEIRSSQFNPGRHRFRGHGPRSTSSWPSPLFQSSPSRGANVLRSNPFSTCLPFPLYNRPSRRFSFPQHSTRRRPTKTPIEKKPNRGSPILTIEALSL